MPDRDRPPAYALARISVDILVPVQDNDERRIGGTLYTATGQVIYDADQAVGYVFGANAQMEEAGYAGRIIDAQLDRVAFMCESAPIGPLDWRKHRAEQEEARDAG